MKRMIVTKVTATEFELDDGRVFQHVSELEEVPTVEEFQKLLDASYEKLGIVPDGQ